MFTHSNAKKPSCFYPIPQAADCILRVVVERANAPVIYLSTDAAESETSLLQSLLVLNGRTVPLVKRPARNSAEKWDALLYRHHIEGDPQVSPLTLLPSFFSPFAKYLLNSTSICSSCFPFCLYFYFCAAFSASLYILYNPVYLHFGWWHDSTLALCVCVCVNFLLMALIIWMMAVAPSK